VLANGGGDLTLILLTSTKWRAPANASKWQIGFNSAFKGLKEILHIFPLCVEYFVRISKQTATFALYIIN
jgi:hypothetical protein